MLLDRHGQLLSGEAVPAPKRLRVSCCVGVIVCHVAAHDVGGVLRDIDAGFEPILQLHSGCILGADAFPSISVFRFE